MDHVDALIAQIRDADDDRREEIKAELIALCQGPGGSGIRDHLEREARSSVLEVQWELEEVVEETAPKVAPPPAPEPEPEPEPEAEPDAQDKPLTAADLDLVYDDPRGLLLHRTKDGLRWFATQMNPSTGQPQTFELHAQEIDALKQQLAGSPYWAIGAGGV